MDSSSPVVPLVASFIAATAALSGQGLALRGTRRNQARSLRKALIVEVAQIKRSLDTAIAHSGNRDFVNLDEVGTPTNLARVYSGSTGLLGFLRAPVEITTVVEFYARLFALRASDLNNYERSELVGLADLAGLVVETLE